MEYDEEKIQQILDICTSHNCNCNFKFFSEIIDYNSNKETIKQILDTCKHKNCICNFRFLYKTIDNIINTLNTIDVVNFTKFNICNSLVHDVIENCNLFIDNKEKERNNMLLQSLGFIDKK